MVIKIQVRGKLSPDKLKDVVNEISDSIANIDLIITRSIEYPKYDISMSMVYDTSDPESIKTLNTFLKVAQMVEEIDYEIVKNFLSDNDEEIKKKLVSYEELYRDIINIVNNEKNRAIGY